MYDRTPETTPRFRFGITAVGLVGMLGIAITTDTVSALVQVWPAVLGLLAAAGVTYLSVTDPGAFRATRLVEVGLLLLVLPVSYLIATASPTVFAAMVWVLVWSLLLLGVLVVGRPRGLALVLRRLDRGDRAR